MTNLDTLIRIGGVLHLGILIASALVPGALEWKRELEKLRPLSRQLVWVHGVFIVLTIIGFGVISLIAAPDLASGTRLARAFCAFVAIFWLARLGRFRGNAESVREVALRLKPAFLCSAQNFPHVWWVGQ